MIMLELEKIEDALIYDGMITIVVWLQFLMILDFVDNAFVLLI